MGAPDLLNPERRMLRAMQLSEAERSWDLDSLLAACDWTDQAVAVGAGHGLQNHGLVNVDEQVLREISLDVGGEDAQQNGLLEHRIWSWMNSLSEDESPTMRGLQEAFERHEAGPGVGLLKQLGVSLDGGLLVASNPDEITDVIAQRTEFLASLPALADTLDPAMLAHFSARKNLVKAVERTVRHWTLTPKGQAVSSDELQETVVITDLTPELLQGDAWKTAEFRAFDVSLEAATPRTGRSHPMQALIERIRAIFLEMGFSELVADYVQSAGWNMDALFIPQDHPAREMQDTFYLDQPSTIDLDEGVMQAWKDIHEHGGETGSTGWGGSYSTDVSKLPLLRTHTTVNTIQYLAEHPTEACRVFSVDRVFRKEAIDRTHLPEFHQIE